MLNKTPLACLFLFSALLIFPVLANQHKLTLIEKKLANIESNQAKVDFLLKFDSELLNLSKTDQARYWYLLGMAKETNQQLTEAINAFSRSINLAEGNVTSDTPRLRDQLVESLLARSYNKYLQTYDPAIYCDDRQKAFNYLNNIIDIDLKTKTLVEYSFCLNKQKDKLAYTLSLLNDALDLAKNNNLSPNTQGMIYNALAQFFGKNQLHEKAYQYLLSAYQQWSKVSDYQDMFNMLHSLTARAIDNLRFDLAKQHVAAMFALAKAQPQFNDFTFFSYYNAALVAQNQGDFPLAIKEYNHALSLQHTTKEKYFVRLSYENISILYFRTQQKSIAQKTLQDYRTSFIPVQYINKTLLALEQEFNGNKQASYQVFFSLLDEQVNKRREFTHFATQAAANLNNSKIHELDIRVLEQDLSINQLSLTNTLQEKQFMRSILIFSVILVCSLLIFISYLLKIQLKFRRYARTDGLTGIANRRFILELGTKMLLKTKTPSEPLSILLFDIDNFKQINDKQGHHIGDKAIKLIVSNSICCLRSKDKIGRIGGDEFLILLPETNKREAQAVAERIRQSVKHATDEYFLALNLTAEVSVSIGVVSSRKKDQLQAMIIRADTALYSAKDLGRNVVVISE